MRGVFAAYRSRDGRKLWSIDTHRGIGAGPMTYMAGGRQYVAVMAGYGGSMGMASAYPGAPHKLPNGQILVFPAGRHCQAAGLQARAPAPRQSVGRSLH